MWGTMTTQTYDVHPAALLKDARSFACLAEAGVGLTEQNGLVDGDLNLSRPIDFLFAHALELAFKAFLRAQGGKVEKGSPAWGHNLKALYAACRERGLTVRTESGFGVENVIGAYYKSNADEGLRYFTMHSTVRPEAAFARKTVVSVFAAVAPYVDAFNEVGTGQAVKCVMTLAEPQEQSPGDARRTPSS